jgi:hypothetical protein
MVSPQALLLTIQNVEKSKHVAWASSPRKHGQDGRATNLPYMIKFRIINRSITFCRLYIHEKYESWLALK